MAGEYLDDKPNDFEQWRKMRDDAREAGGGILIESSTDDPKDIIDANLFQPRVLREQVVTRVMPIGRSARGCDRTSRTDFRDSLWRRPGR